MTVLGETSDPLPISGLHFRPDIISLYVTNLPDSVLTSHVAIIADNTRIYKQIKSREDAAYLYQLTCLLGS